MHVMSAAWSVAETVQRPVAPSHADPVVAATSHLIGGPLGRRARTGGRRWWTVWRVLIALTVLTCTLGWAQKAQCRDTRNWSHADGVYQYTRLCYSDVVALYGSEGLESGKRPYVGHAVEYPVLIGAVMQAGAEVAGLAAGTHAEPQGQISQDQRAAAFYDVTVLLLAFAALAAVVCTGLASGRRRSWDAAMVALAPTLVIHLATNWDMIAVALATGALAAWSRRHPVLAGTLLGLATATKAYPALFLIPLLLLCVRAGKLRAWVTATALTAGVTLGLYAVVWPFSPAFSEPTSGDPTIVGRSAWQALTGSGGSLHAALRSLAPHHDGGANGLLRFVTLNRTRPADFDTLWYALQQATGTTVTTSRLNLAVAGVLFLALGALAALTLLAPQRPRLPSLCFLLVAAFLLINKVDSPQYTLWLLPLAVLARPRWGPFLAWQFSEVLLLLARFGFFINLAGTNKGAPYGYFCAAVLLRDALLVLLMVLVVRDVLAPGRDVVRVDGDDDPCGGVLDGAADRGDDRRDDRSAEPGPSGGGQAEPAREAIAVGSPYPVP